MTLLARALERVDLRVNAVSDVDEALSWVTATGHDLLVLDSSLDSTAMFQLYSSWRDGDVNVPRPVIFSRYVAERTARDGADLYLPAAVETEQVAVSARHVLDHGEWLDPIPAVASADAGVDASGETLAQESGAPAKVAQNRSRRLEIALLVAGLVLLILGLIFVLVRRDIRLTSAVPRVVTWTAEAASDIYLSVAGSPASHDTLRDWSA